MVADMVRAGKPGKTVASVDAPGGMFLEERLHDAPSLALMRSQTWSYVIFQAQKYSTSGQFHTRRRKRRSSFASAAHSARCR